MPAQNLKELMAYIKSQPGKLSYGTSGVGTPPHLSGELFKAMAGLEIEHIPYKGGGPAMADLLGGNIPVLFDVLTGAASHIKSGRVRAIAVTTPARSPSFPEIQEKLKELSATPVGSTLDSLAAHVKAELDKWGPMIKTLGLKLE